MSFLVTRRIGLVFCLLAISAAAFGQDAEHSKSPSPTKSPSPGPVRAQVCLPDEDIINLEVGPRSKVIDEMSEKLAEAFQRQRDKQTAPKDDQTALDKVFTDDSPFKNELLKLKISHTEANEIVKRWLKGNPKLPQGLKLTMNKADFKAGLKAHFKEYFQDEIKDAREERYLDAIAAAEKEQDKILQKAREAGSLSAEDSTKLDASLKKLAELKSGFKAEFPGGSEMLKLNRLLRTNAKKFEETIAKSPTFEPTPGSSLSSLSTLELPEPQPQPQQPVIINSSLPFNPADTRALIAAKQRKQIQTRETEIASLVAQAIQGPKRDQYEKNIYLMHAWELQRVISESPEARRKLLLQMRTSQSPLKATLEKWVSEDEAFNGEK